MASHLRLLCCMFGLLAVQELSGAEGVTFSLDPVETKVDGQATCGVLHCWDEVKPGSASNISSLTVYKLEAGRRVTLTTLSREIPIDNGTFGDIEVDGMWTPEKAEVNLSLVEKDDCTLVQFFCQVRYTDGQWKERMSSAVVGREDVTTFEQTENTPSPESDGETSAMSGEVLSSTDGTRLVAIEEPLNTMVGVSERLTGAVSYIQIKAEGRMLTALKGETRFDADDLQQVSKTILETIRTAVTFLTKDIQSLKEDVRSVKETMEKEVKSINETMGEEVKSIKETIKEEVKSVNKTIKEEIESVKWTVRSDRWIVIQRRSRGDVDFYRNWDSYKKGFGSPDGDFWLGNNRIHVLTSGARYELRVTLGYEGKINHANYDSFSISGEKDNYRLHIGNYEGNAGDSLRYHNEIVFSTFDRDNDLRTTNCAVDFRGGWWYKSCHHANLNGKWGADAADGPRWFHLTNYYPATFTEMKIREVIV